MKLYYAFGATDTQDYEYEVQNGMVAQYLKTITQFTRDEIMSNFDLFAKVFEHQIYNHFKDEAVASFELEPELESKRIVSYLKQKETSKRNRLAFIKREALKKKGMVEWRVWR